MLEDKLPNPNLEKQEDPGRHTGDLLTNRWKPLEHRLCAGMSPPDPWTSGKAVSSEDNGLSEFSKASRTVA